MSGTTLMHRGRWWAFLLPLLVVSACGQDPARVAADEDALSSPLDSGASEVGATPDWWMPPADGSIDGSDGIVSSGEDGDENTPPLPPGPDGMPPLPPGLDGMPPLPPGLDGMPPLPPGLDGMPPLPPGLDGGP